ncbi:MAG: hypothetical protein WCK89_19775 [bacterium]
MSKFLHLNLLKDEERYSSSPIRLRVLLPMIAALATLCCLVWWMLLALRAYNQLELQERLQKSILEKKSTHATILDLRAQEQETMAVIHQLQLYEHARIRFGATLSQLAAHVPTNIQFTEIRLLPPPPIPLDPKNPSRGPTNTVEAITLLLAGRTMGENSSEAVDTLLAALRTPAFTNLIQTAEIPKGAFRQDVGRNADARDTLLFEIKCGCVPRRFE